MVEVEEGRFYKTGYDQTIKVLKINSATIEAETQGSDYKIRATTVRTRDILFEMRRKEWDKMPRSKEPASFHLRKDYTIPTNTSMYYCRHCQEDSIEHQVEDIPAPGVNFGKFRKCTGCQRQDGPWVPYGDD